MADGRPSQKFMAKAQAQISLSGIQGFCFMACPNASSDATSASLVIAVGSFSNGKFVTDSTWRNATVGDLVAGAGNSISRLSTNTPYTAATLATGFEYACVGSGLKFTYEGAELYRGGTLRYLYDKDGAYNQTNDWTIDTLNGVIDFVNSAPNTVRQSINKENVVEINTTSTSDFYLESENVTNVSYGVGGFGLTQPVGGTTATTTFGVRPNVIGYYQNTSGNAISFHIDLVEHWSVSSPTIQSLQSPSYSHVGMSVHAAALMDNVRQNHASAPNVKHIDVTKTTMAALKSPIGHELLNAGIRAALL